MQAGLGERAQPLHLGPYGRLTKPGEAIRPASIYRLERLDQPASLKTSQGPVERSRPHRRTADRFDVGHDRVPVLRALAQGHEDVQRRFSEPSEIEFLILHRSVLAWGDRIDILKRAG